MPVVLDAMNALLARLAVIDGTAPYVTTLVTRELQGRIWEQVPDTERPYVGIQLLGGQPTYMPTMQVRTTADVALVCHLPFVENPATRLASQLDLLTDVYRALAPPFTSPGLIKFSVGSWRVDGPDPLSVHTIRINIALDYRASLAGS